MSDKRIPQDPEEKSIETLLTLTLKQAIIHWQSLDQADLTSDTVLDVQTKFVLDFLEKLNLPLSILAKLNTQDAMVFQIRHMEHYKGGHYVWLGEGLETESQQPLTAYKNPEKNKWWFRPADMFNEYVPRTQQLRFMRRVMARLIADDTRTDC
jgi:hypothetical protein